MHDVGPPRESKPQEIKVVHTFLKLIQATCTDDVVQIGEYNHSFGAPVDISLNEENRQNWQNLELVSRL
jgi:hypothetical protein